jgi:RNA polymerase primary sigma factor
MKRARLLTAADEARLARRIERGDLAAKDELVTANLGLVYALARNYRGRGVPFEDLVQEGSVGLIRAAEKFDYRRGLKFSTYAVWLIRRSMHDAISSSNVIRVPATANRELAAVRRAEERLGSRRASDAGIAELTQLSERTVRSRRSAAQVVASLDAPVGEAATPLGELIADARAVDPSESAIAHEERDGVAALLPFLPQQHREVLVRRYGLNGNRVQSHKEIGRWLGVGEERSRQIERDSLHRLRSISATSALAA